MSMKKSAGKSTSRNLLAVAERRRAKLAALLEPTASVPDVEHVHDLRVASRRLAEITRLLAVRHPKATGRILDTLRDLRQAAGDLRDLDVMREHLAALAIPPTLRPAVRAQMQAMEKQRSRLAKSLVDHLMRPALASAMTDLAEMLLAMEQERNAPSDLRDVLEQRVAQCRDGVEKAFRKALLKPHAERLHRARIAAKKLRYALELQAEVGDAAAEAEVRLLKQVQEILGLHHDLEVLRGFLADALGSPTGASAKARVWREWSEGLAEEQMLQAGAFFVAQLRWRQRTPAA